MSLINRSSISCKWSRFNQTHLIIDLLNYYNNTYSIKKLHSGPLETYLPESGYTKTHYDTTLTNTWGMFYKYLEEIKQNLLDFYRKLKEDESSYFLSTDSSLHLSHYFETIISAGSNPMQQNKINTKVLVQDFKNYCCFLELTWKLYPVFLNFISLNRDPENSDKHPAREELRKKFKWFLSPTEFDENNFKVNELFEKLKKIGREMYQVINVLNEPPMPFFLFRHHHNHTL